MSELHRRGFLQTVTAGIVSAAPAASAAADPPAVYSLPGSSLPPPKESTPSLRRGPYLQAQGSDRMVVRWRTDGSSRKCLLRYGDTPETLDRVVQAELIPSGFPDLEDWGATVEGLQPSHTYYYAIEASTAVLAGADDAHYFRTAPARGTASPARFWMLGDCGTNRVDTGNPGKSVAARNGFRKFNRGHDPVDGMFLLGDNAYSHGTDSQYQTAVFSVYADELRNTPVWPCIGNHELTDDYFGIFTVPSSGEAGGVASECSNYYSFDYANIHFVVLDLWKAEWREPGAPQRRWLERDLAVNRRDWLVVVNHFPPYCAGKYESDHNGFLVEVREKILPILEANGVDLLITGHDHTYQRSYLIDAHYGPRATFDPSKHMKAKGDGRSEPLVKKHGPHQGMIAVVTGAAGAPQPIDPSNPPGLRLDHPAMVEIPNGDQAGRGVRKLGTFLLEIDGLALTGIQIDDHGHVVDRFSLRKIR